MERLIAGYRAFRAQRWPQERSLYEETASLGQKPEYLIIACSDSRSDPATIFGGRPGEFFILRNIAALVPPNDGSEGIFSTRAAIAYAVLALKVRNIVVMGHAQCGGIAAAMNPQAAQGIPYVGEWVALAKPAVANAHDHADSTQVEHEAVKLSVARLLEYPFIAERVASGELKVHGARFGIADGVLEWLDRKSGTFEPVKT